MKLKKLKKRNSKRLSFTTCVTLGVPNTNLMRTQYRTIKDNDVLDFIMDYTQDEDLQDQKEIK